MKNLESILKSLFITLYPFVALLVVIHTLFQSIKNGWALVDLGVLLMASSVVILFAGLFIRPRARTDKNLNLFSLGIGIGLLIGITGLFNLETDLIEIIPGLVLGVGWLIYLKWYSLFTDRNKSFIRVGSQLEEFELENSKSEKVASSTFLGNPSIFLFYRGNWCPLCMAQIKEIAAQYEELEKLGVNTILISPQPHKYSERLAKRYNLNFHFLVDAKNKVAQQLGISAENGIPAGFQVLGYASDTVMPTVVITNKFGNVIFADLTDNYRVRPEPQEFLKVILESIA